MKILRSENVLLEYLELFMLLVLVISFLIGATTVKGINNKSKDLNFFSGEVRLILPDTIYAVPGKETNIYFDNVILAIDSKQYVFDVTCSKGMHFDEIWTYTPKLGEEGDYEFNLEVRNASNKIVARASSTLQVVSPEAGAGEKVTVLMIGDSLTAASFYPEWFLENCSDKSGLNVTLIGSHGPNGKAGDKIKHEGYGGWQAKHFVSHYTGIARRGEIRSQTCGSPFIYADSNDSHKLDFARYCQEYNQGLAPDVITIFLGCNDVFGATENDLEDYINRMLNNYNQLLDMIHEYNGDTKIGIMLPVPPAASQDSFGANYKCGQTRWQYKWNQHRLLERMTDEYGQREEKNLFIVPTYLNIDSVHNFPVYGNAPWNRHSKTEGIRQRDSVHPDESGYRQIGDTLYCWFKGIYDKNFKKGIAEPMKKKRNITNESKAIVKDMTFAQKTTTISVQNPTLNEVPTEIMKVNLVGKLNSTKNVLRAGTAKVNITTNAKDVVINDPLFAKVLVLEDGENKLVIISMDVIAIGTIFEVEDDFLANLRTRVQNELDIPALNILVNASHTHPPGKLLCNNQELINRTFEAVKNAQKNMIPVKIGGGIGYEDRIMINRTLRLKNGNHWTMRHTNPCPPDNEVESLGPVDPEIGIIRIDKTNGTPFAVLYNFACHPLLGMPGGPVTANYPGFASKIIEQQLGNDVMAFFLQGAGGDINETLYKDVSQPRNAEPIGTMLGMSTLKAFKDIETKNAKLSIINETIELPRRTDIPDKIKILQKEQSEILATLRYTSLNFKAFLPLYLKYSLNSEFPSDYSYRYIQEQDMGLDNLSKMDSENQMNIQKYVKNIQRMENLARIQDHIETYQYHQENIDKAEGKPFSVEVMGIKFGDSLIVTCSAEVLVQVGLNIKKASPYDNTFMAAYSNGYIFYGPPADYYGKGGYESIECELAPEWQKIYEEKANEIIRRL